MFGGTGFGGLALAVLLASVMVGPGKSKPGKSAKSESAKSGEGAKLTKEQLEYSKQMFAEGDALMAKGDYAKAYEKFAEGYRYAPHLHAFTYNIALAADALGDCKLAKRYFQMFVDLVPEHPERQKVLKKLDGLKKTCMEDAESSVVASQEVPKADKADRLKAEGDRAMNEALFQLRVSYAAYANGKVRFKKVKTFRAPMRHKKRHAKKMKKLLESYGIKLEDREVPEPELPLELEAACRIAKVQENRTLRALELAMEKFDTADAYRIMSRFVSVGERDLERFEACS